MKTIQIIPVILLVMIPSIAFAQSTAQITMFANKQSYTTGDAVTISGTISQLGSSNSAVLQVYNPFNVLVQIGTVDILPDGTFHSTIKAQGQSWNNDGSYQIKMIYISTPILATATTSIDFKTTQTPSSISSTQTPTQNNMQTIPSDSPTIEEQIQQRIALANKLTQQIEQGNKTEIPFWVKDTARKWNDGIITNVEFSKNIQYFISSGLVKVDRQVKPTVFEHIPSWQKKVAGWWSQGAISDYDYINSIQFLLDENVIRP